MHQQFPAPTEDDKDKILHDFAYILKHVRRQFCVNVKGVDQEQPLSSRLQQPFSDLNSSKKVFQTYLAYAYYLFDKYKEITDREITEKQFKEVIQLLYAKSANDGMVIKELDQTQYIQKVTEVELPGELAAFWDIEDPAFRHKFYDSLNDNFQIAHACVVPVLKEKDDIDRDSVERHCKEQYDQREKISIQIQSDPATKGRQEEIERKRILAEEQRVFLETEKQERNKRLLQEWLKSYRAQQKQQTLKTQQAQQQTFKNTEEQARQTIEQEAQQARQTIEQEAQQARQEIKQKERTYRGAAIASTSAIAGAVGAGIGAVIGGVFFGIGAVPGALIGAAAGAIGGAIWGGVTSAVMSKDKGDEVFKGDIGSPRYYGSTKPEQKTDKTVAEVPTPDKRLTTEEALRTIKREGPE
jgi:outer membrane lipoprotein SlyB